jgi:hypothetical protein
MKNSRLEVGHTNLQALKLKKSARCSAAAFNSKVCHAVNILSNTAAVVWSVFVLVERRESFNSSSLTMSGNGTLFPHTKSFLMMYINQAIFCRKELIMISKKTFLLLYAKPWDYVLNL